jgi:DNA primase
MRFSDDTIQQIKDSVSIVDIVSEYTNLKQSGNDYKGLCPFHNENTPSFHVSTEKGVYYCFGCKRGGDIFSFLSETDGFSFSEAVEYLASRAGITIKQTKSGDNGFAKTLEFAQSFFRKKLKAKVGKRALEYLKDRGISKKLAFDFGIGYAPDAWDAFYSEAIKNGISEEHLHRTGLITTSKIGKPIDFFRNGVTIPIRNRGGKVVAFGMRNLSDNGPKYINSPNNPLYKKDDILFGYSYARRSIRKRDFVFLTEGYFDAISLWEAGYFNAVAVCGTALTAKQAVQIRRITKNATILYDGDSAGLNATLKAIPILLRAGLSTRILRLPEDEDPDSFVRNSSKEDVDKFFESHKDFFNFVLGVHIKGGVPTDVPQKIKIINGMKPFINSIRSSFQKGLYIKKLADIIECPLDEIERFLEQHSKVTQKEVKTQSDRLKSHESEMELFLISCLLCDNELHDIIRKVNPFQLYKGIYESMIDIYDERGSVSFSDVSGLFSDSKDSSFVGKSIYNMDPDKLTKKFIKVLIIRQEKHYSRQLQKIKQRLIKAEDKKDKFESEKLNEHIRRLEKKRNTLLLYRNKPLELLNKIKKINQN